MDNQLNDEDLDAQISQLSGNQEDSSGLNDPDFLKALSAPDTAPAVPTKVKPQTQPNKTIFQDARSAAPENSDMSWGEALSEAGKNILPSIGGVLAATGHAIFNPSETLGALENLGSGIASKVSGAVGVPQDANQKAKNEALLDAMLNQYKQTYGSAKGFKQALAKDPASILMDASTFLGGAGGVGKLAGLGKAAEVIAKTGSVVDPVQLAVNAAKYLGKPVMGVTRLAQSISTGVPRKLLKAAEDAGVQKDPTFWKFFSGQGDPSELQSAAQGALGEIKKDASDAYLTDKGKLNSTIDLSNVKNDIQNRRNELNSMGAPSGYREEHDTLNRAESLVDEVISDPSRQSLQSVDALKQQIWALKDRLPNATDKEINTVYHSIRNTLGAAPGYENLGGDAGYMKLMENYQDGQRQINDLTKSLALGNKSAASASAAKMLKSMKTQGGGNLLDKIVQKRPEVLNMLSGMALNHATPGGLQGIIEKVAAAPLTFFGHPVAAAGTLIAGSPKVAGLMQYGAGRLSALPSEYQNLIKSAYFAGRTGQEKNNTSDQSSGSSGSTDYNVGNIRSESGGFKGYNSPEEGIAAAASNLRSYPGRFNSGKPMSLREIANKWAPREDNNDPDAWANNVSSVAGVHPDAPIDVNDNSLMPRIVKGIHAAEHGQKSLYPDETYGNALRTQHASGGRITRATGGKVEHAKHEMLVNRLMRMAKNAKQLSDKATEPLLNVPDEAVVKALDVAQQAI
jgi:hypothetical protein